MVVRMFYILRYSFSIYATCTVVTLQCGVYKISYIVIANIDEHTISTYAID